MYLLIKAEALGQPKPRWCSVMFFKGPEIEVEFETNERIKVKAEDIIGLSFEEKRGYSKTILFSNAFETNYNLFL